MGSGVGLLIAMAALETAALASVASALFGWSFRPPPAAVGFASPPGSVVGAEEGSPPPPPLELFE